MQSEYSAHQLHITPVIGKRPPMGTATRAQMADVSTCYMEDHWPVREPEKSHRLLELLSQSFAVRMRTDLPPEVARQYSLPTAKHPRGIPLVASYGQKHDRRTHTTVPVQSFEFYPWRDSGPNARLHRVLPFEVASHLLADPRWGALLEEIPMSAILDVPLEEDAPAGGAK